LIEQEKVEMKPVPERVESQGPPIIPKSIEANVISVEDDVKQAKAPSPQPVEPSKSSSIESLPPPKKKGLEPLPSVKSPEPDFNSSSGLKIDPVSADEEKKGI